MSRPLILPYPCTPANGTPIGDVIEHAYANYTATLDWVGQLYADYSSQTPNLSSLLPSKVGREEKREDE